MLASALKGDWPAYDVRDHVLRKSWNSPEAPLDALYALGFSPDSQRATRTAWSPYPPNTDSIAFTIACVPGRAAPALALVGAHRAELFSVAGPALAPPFGTQAGLSEMSLPLASLCQ
jgi:hypothetical protein